MPDELRPDEMQDLWRNQPRDPVRMSADDVRRKARQFEAQTRRGFRITAGIMICSAACTHRFSTFSPGPSTDWLQPYTSRLSVLRISVPQKRPGEKRAGRSARDNLCRTPGGTQAPARLLLD